MSVLRDGNGNSINSSNPLPAAGKGIARTSNPTAFSSGSAADIILTSVGGQVTKQYSIPELDWSYAAAAGGITNTTDVAAKAAGAAGIRNYVTNVQLLNSSATATEFVIKDGATVIWRTLAPANMTTPVDMTFTTPLRGSAATALNIACVTTGAAVYANVQGYQAP